MQFKKTELTETENRIVVAGDWEIWKWELLVKGYKCPGTRGVSSEALIHSMVTLVNNTALYIYKLLRE